ncbi:MAG: class I SAM-dependent methyltransferase [Bacilli bacterium]|nr:class I SAM-dependent methyltransferase [Bacilli bacterium]
MSNYKDRWNKMHKEYFEGNIKYDNWLDEYIKIINESKKEIIDLGCGVGNNSLYLNKLGKKVIACDFSDEALRIVKNEVPSVKIKGFDMLNEFPFKDNFTDLVIADLSLHYFSYQETIKILHEIKRILTNNGHLLFRVNSLNDINHGSEEGIEIEKHYFEIEDIKKRFFNEKDLIEFFSDWDIIDLQEETMTRYEKDKVLWKGLVCNLKSK